MILSNSYKTVEINITTYKTKQRERNNSKIMNENTERFKKFNQNRFICSICLNKKASQEDTRDVECCKRKSKSCPVCQKPCEIDESKNGCIRNEYKCEKDIIPKGNNVNKDGNGKTIIQTPQPDITKGLTLLTEVLTVFQTKKQENQKDTTNKATILKDVSVETERQIIKPKLSFSKTFCYSLGEHNETQKNGKFLVINSQPEIVLKSLFSIDLKHKSSSIPQMRLEELKQSLKEKTKSKDAIEEVNRMFATVRKYELCESLDNSNRPMLRNGPRVLPVVKTNAPNSGSDNTRVEKKEFLHCQTSYQMSGGDSMRGCHYKQDKSDNCCNCYYKHRCPEIVCEHCSSVNKKCNHFVDIYDD